MTDPEDSDLHLSGRGGNKEPNLGSKGGSKIQESVVMLLLNQIIRDLKQKLM